MLEIHFTDKTQIYTQLKSALSPHICGDFSIKRTVNGKPYIEGDPVYFSVSHSGNHGVFVICDKPAGVDMEIYKKRNFSSLLSRFTVREREEINGDLKNFLKNWVIKEAYIKMLGSTLAKTLFELEYFGGTLLYNGNAANCEITVKELENRGIYAICTGETL